MAAVQGKTFNFETLKTRIRFYLKNDFFTFIFCSFVVIKGTTCMYIFGSIERSRCNIDLVNLLKTFQHITIH